MARKPGSYKLSHGRKGVSTRAIGKKSVEQLEQEKEDERWQALAKDTVRMACLHMDLLGE